MMYGVKNNCTEENIWLHRTTFLLDEKGTIKKIFLRPRNKQHAQEIIKAWQQLSPQK